MKLRKFSTLEYALGISVAVHAVLLTVRFVDPEAIERAFRDTPLEVILVNARGNARPDKALAIAQTSLAGGGEAERGRATSPLPSTQLSDSGDTLEEESQKRMQQLQKQQTMLLAQVRQQLASLPLPDPKQARPSNEQAAQEAKRRLLLKQLAEIERRIKQDSQKPRKRYIGPSTREEAYAIYYDRLRRAIEDKGTENFPSSGGRKLYGELTMVVTVNRQGQVVSTEIAESSGNRVLDRRAEAIARASAPFGRFTESMRKEADQIVVVSRFKFSRNETLETRLSAP
ncbi:energy transducer TonB [Rhodoferax sp. BAB1]|uniref:energy transducer TonB n=1 Tax=Rhodoferax sp. BAB1 TaxID=2741720 RepID=UPI001575E21F|nr:TonB family protein [Rhodoferax sp. BAB1]QKO22902.1 TonB family protein [Rhodoferax sp. BAB1]